MPSASASLLQDSDQLARRVGRQAQMRLRLPLARRRP